MNDQHDDIRPTGRARALCIPALAAISMLFGAVPAPAQDGPRPEARAVRASGPIDLDGRLDEPAWTSAPVARGFVQIEPNQGEAPTFDTDVRVLYDEHYLYFGAYMRDTVGFPGIRVPDLRRDFGYFDNDLFGVSLDPFGDGRNAIAFQVNPRGALRDLRSFDGTLFDREWRGVWEARTEVSDSGWTAEIRIPWTTLRYPPPPASAAVAGSGSPALDPDPIAAWRVQFVRRHRRLGEEHGWAPWPRQHTAYHMRYAGLLHGLAPPPPARNVQVQPYATARGQEARQAGISDRTAEPAVGGDLKWAVTPNTVLDLTLNTDFAEADVDREVLDLTRFSVFFPEQRAFFLENAGLFRAGGDRWVEPFFTRRIGLDPAGRPIPLDGGARLTHQSPSRSGGAMLLRQRGTGDQPATHFAVGRFQRNVGREHRVGALVVSRMEEGGADNHVGALDFFYRPVRTTFLRGMVSASRTTDPETSHGWSAFAHLSNNFPWGYLGWVQAVISADYRADTGYVPRPDLVTTSPAANLDLRPAWLPASVRSYRPGITTAVYHRASDRRFEEAWLTFRPLYISFHDGSEANVWLRRDWQRLERVFRPVPGFEIEPGDYEFTSFGFTRQPDLSRPYWTYITVATGRFYDRRMQRLVYRASPLPGPRVGLTFDYIGNRFRATGDAEAETVTTHLLGVQARLALDPRAQFTTFYQRNTAFRVASWNTRFAWEFRPLSFAYLVFNDGYRRADRVTGAPAGPRERQLTLKVTWVGQL